MAAPAERDQSRITVDASSTRDVPRVLIVDDDPGIQTAMNALFRELEYDLRRAGGGSAAKSMISSGEIDIVICDMLMPQVSGLNVLEFTQKFHPMIPVIMLTGDHNLPRLISAFKLGAADYLVKPVKLEALRDALDHCVAWQKQRRSDHLVRWELNQLLDIMDQGRDSGSSHEWRTDELKRLVSRLGPE